MQVEKELSQKMENEELSPESVEDVRGMKLGDRVSYLSNTLDELESSQMDPSQTHFQVPENVEEHIKLKRAEASEELKKMSPRTEISENHPEEESTQSTISDKKSDAMDSAKTGELEGKMMKSPSWSAFNSPDHTEIDTHTKESKLDSIPEEIPEAIKNPEKPVKKPTIKANFGYKRKGVESSNQRYKPIDTAKINEYGTNLPKKEYIIKESRETQPQVGGTSNTEERKEEADQTPKRSQGNRKQELPTARKRDTSKLKAKPSHNYEGHDWDAFYEEDYDEKYETSEYIQTSDQLINSINEAFSSTNLYPSDDHVDHIFYIHNNEGMTDRDLYFYTLGVSKERSISFAKKTMDMMNKLEGLLSLANKNLSTTTTNLKISENNITSLRNAKKSYEMASEKGVDKDQNEGSKISAEIVTRSRILSREDKAKDKVEISKIKPDGEMFLSQKNPHQIFVARKSGTLKINEPKETNQIKKVPEDKASSSRGSEELIREDRKDISENELAGDKVAEKIAAFHAVNISDALLENESILSKLLPMMTDKLMENVNTGSIKYKETVKKIILDNLKKQIQREKEGK